MNECPTQEDLDRYTANLLTTSEEVEMNEHVVYCDRCKSLLLSSEPMVAGATIAFGRIHSEPSLCPSNRELFDYVDEKLPAGAASKLAGHISICRDCNGLVDDLKSEKRYLDHVYKRPAEPELQPA